MYLKFSTKQKQDTPFAKSKGLEQAESTSEDRLKMEQQKLQQKQEDVLKLQSILKLYLALKRDLKKHINKDFVSFCNEKFGFIVPHTHELNELDIMSTVSIL